MESDVKQRHQLKKNDIVLQHMEASGSYLISTFRYGFYDNVDKVSITIKKSPTFWFFDEGLLLEGEHKPLKTNLVILATGFNGQKKLEDL